MPKNKSAAYRYRLIDSALRNTGRKWTFEALLDYVQEKLYENYDVQGCSQRTLENDIALMRKASPEGFNAPIKRAKGYIFYADPDYSIHNQPLIESDIKTLQAALDVLEQFKGLPHAGQILQIVEKVKGVLKMPEKTRSENIIFFEHNDDLVGLNWLEPLVNQIRNKNELKIIYHPFYEENSSELIFHPFFLQEFNNRWYVIGLNVNENINWVLALDRIKELAPTGKKITSSGPVSGGKYFENVIGVTIPNGHPIETIKLKLSSLRAPYVVTKPMHHSQKVLATETSGAVTIELKMILNRELKAELLSFGPDIEVLSPERLREEMKSLLEQAGKLYG
ncbi:MAG: WYL domain-containing protein [Saprospiraceae bacterium]|nr:WYL domain-containing protein [Saprospiraceae bacterium]MCB9323939.1 WYL domain-containing protein [Lewinellaceae bacterium]